MVLIFLFVIPGICVVVLFVPHLSFFGAFIRHCIVIIAFPKYLHLYVYECLLRFSDRNKTWLLNVNMSWHVYVYYSQGLFLLKSIYTTYN